MTLTTGASFAIALRVSAASDGRFRRDHADVLLSAALAEDSTAARAPGSITPITSTPTARRIAGSASADAVLHATTSSLMPCASRNSEFSTA